MQFLSRHQADGHLIEPPFRRIALEFAGAHNQAQWYYVPHILTLRDPDDLEFIHETMQEREAKRAMGAFSDCAGLEHVLQTHRKNLVINLQDRIPEIEDALKEKAKGAVCPDTITGLGRRGYTYEIGLAIDQHAIPALLKKAVFNHCDFRVITQEDTNRLMGIKKNSLVV